MLQSANGSSFDLAAWIKTHNVGVRDVEPYDGGQRWKLVECPFNAEHKGTSVALGRLANGQPWFKCQHDGCAGKTWRDARERLQPGWRRPITNLTSNPKEPSLEVRLEMTSRLSCDAADLLSEAGDDELQYMTLLGREGYLVRGWSHLLAGYPRVGKTELILATLRLWLEAGHRVLFFTEEPRTMWRHRLRQQRDWPRGLRLYFGLGIDPNELLAEMRQASESNVIVDTIRNLLQFEDENNNSEVARKINPWVVGARETEKTLLLSHHMRKGSGDHGEGIAGGHALLGVVDIALEVVRDRNLAANRRKIRAYARLIQPDELLYEMTPGGSLQALGEPGAVARAEVERRVLAEIGTDWIKTADLVESLADPRPSREQVRLVLAALARQGVVDRDPSIDVEKTAGKTVRWRRAFNLTSNGTVSRLEVRLCEECNAPLAPTEMDVCSVCYSPATVEAA